MSKKNTGSSNLRPCPRNCNGGSIRQTHGLCMGNGCNDCGRRGWTWVTCPRCNGNGTVYN